MRVLRVSGRGEVTTKPDLAVVSFRIESKNRDYARCVQYLNELTAKVKRQITAAGVEWDDIKTTDFDVSTDYDYRDGRSIFLGYEARHSLRIEIPMDTELLNKVLQNVSVGRSGARISLDFRVKDEDAVRRRILAKAVAVARENAAVLAEAAGLKLGKILRIDYNWSEIRVHHEESLYLMESTPMLAPDAGINPKDIKSGDTVTLVYEILDD